MAVMCTTFVSLLSRFLQIRRLRTIGHPLPKPAGNLGSLGFDGINFQAEALHLAQKAIDGRRPMTGAMQRRLAAILAADVVGYSKLMGQDEAGTHGRLKAHRKDFIEPLIAEHGGRIVKLTGDGVLVEFPSAVEAVLCATTIQRGMAKRNEGEPPERRIDFRIGINLGDIIFDEGDIYGDGVNIAARLEGLAEPGGICLSRTVYDHVRAKVDLGFESLGEHRVKNISDLVAVYRVLPSGATRITKQPRQRLRHRQKELWLAATFALLIVGGGTWWAAPKLGGLFDEDAKVSTQAAGLPLPEKPSVAVLPFDNLSGEPRFDRLAAGLHEDIITDLSRYRDLFVIARNSTEGYKGKSVDIRQVAQELGVRYVMEGSLQADAKRIRITAQLIDGASGAHAWSERYDRPIDDVFVIQDEVTQAIVARLAGTHGEVANSERQLAKRKTTNSLKAYELYLIAVEGNDKYTEEDAKKSEDMLSKAIGLDPNFAMAYVQLAWTYERYISYGWNLPTDEAYARWLKASQKALELDPLNAPAHMTLGWYYSYKSDFARALVEMKTAINLAPNSADNLIHAAGLLPWLGQPEMALENVERALRLNPRYPDWWLNSMGTAYFYAGQFAEALKTRKLEPEPWMADLAMAYAQTGNHEQASKAAADLLTKEPDYSAERTLSDYGTFARDEELNLFLDSHRKAKLPVCATDAQLTKYANMTHLPTCDAERARS